MSNDATTHNTSTEVDAAKARPRIRPGRIVTGILIAGAFAWFVFFLISNPRFEWPVVGKYLFDPFVLAGLGMSILLTLIGMLIGSAIGIGLAAGMLSDFWPVRWASQAYINFFRAIPPLVQLIFWFNLAYLIPRVQLGLPWGPPILDLDTNQLIVPFTAAVIGLSLHEAAYMAEIIRSGLISIDPGQKDAAKALGFSKNQMFWKIVLPQSMRVIIPPTGSQVIGLLKGSSLVSVIAMTELLHAVQNIYSRTYQVVPMLLVAVIWYLTVVTIFSIGQRRIEKYYSRGYDQRGLSRKEAKKLAQLEGVVA